MQQPTLSMSSTSGSVVVRRRPRRRLSAPHPPRATPLLTCSHFSPSVAALDLSTASPAPVLASLRVLVLSYLAELEHNLALPEQPLSETLKKQGEETMDEARAWALESLEMLRRIRDDVTSHFPELPFDATSVELLLRSHMHDFSYPSLVHDIRTHFPNLPLLRSKITEFDFIDVQSKVNDVRSHIPGMPVDLHQPLSYLPILSHRLRSLQAHLAASHKCHESPLPSLSSIGTVSELLDKLLSSDLLPTALHRPARGKESPLEHAAKEISSALKRSLNGSRLVHYVDLPMEWRGNPFVTSGYRFIPLHKWPLILLSLFAIHNETLNIHTHMIPLIHSALKHFRTFINASTPIETPERMFTIFSQLCLFSSVLWHTMSGCAHRQGMELCARVDYVGIGWLISASIGTIVYYGFSCHPQTKWFYLSLCVITGVLGSIFPFMKWFNMRRYKNWRVAFFLGMAFTGLAPLASSSYYYGFMPMLRFISPIAPSLASYIIGLFFYVSHVPERFFSKPNRLSRWTDWLGGGSHAIWHAFIVLAIYQHKWGMREMRSGVAGQGCL